MGVWGATPISHSLLLSRTTAATDDRLRGRRVFHRQRAAADAVERIERTLHRARGRHEPDLTDALRTERPLRLVLLDQDDLHRRRMPCARDPEPAHRHVLRHPIRTAHELL